MEIQKYGISYQFERSGNKPLDNSRIFNTYADVRLWWDTVANFYVTQVIGIGNSLYYFYSLPNSPEESLDPDINAHLIRIIDSSDFGSINFDTTELEEKFYQSLFDTSSNIYNDIDSLDASLAAYAENADASILGILDLIDGDTLSRIEEINMRIANVEAMLQNTDLEMITIIDSSIKNLYNTQWIQDISINRIDTSFQRIYNTYDVSYNSLQEQIDALNGNFEIANTGIGRAGSGEHAEIFNDYTDNRASGDYATVSGKNNKANGEYSFVVGKDNTAYGKGSFIAGENNETAYEYSVIFGSSNKTYAKYNTVVGHNNIADGEYSFIAGLHLYTHNQSEAAFGHFNWSEQQSGSNPYPIFTIGNGNDAALNALTLMSDNKLYLYGLGNYTGTKPNQNAKAVNDLLNELYQITTETNEHIDASIKALNTSIVSLNEFILSDRYLTDNYRENPFNSDKFAFNQLGAYTLYSELIDTSTRLQDNITDVITALNNVDNNYQRKVFDLSTHAEKIELSLNSSVAIINASINDLSTNIKNIQNRLDWYVDPSISQIKDRLSRVETSANLNETAIKRIDASIRKIDTSVNINIKNIYDISSNMALADASIQALETLTKSMPYIKFTEQELTRNQKIVSRQNIDAASQTDVSNMAQEINILLELQKNQLKHLFVDESYYNNLQKFDAGVVYFVVNNGTLTSIAKPVDRTFQWTGDVQRLTSTTTYTVTGEGGSDVGIYKFIVKLNAGYRWNDFTMDCIVVTYTITTDEVFYWQMGDVFPIELI